MEDIEQQRSNMMKQLEIEQKTRELEFKVKLSELKKDSEILRKTQEMNSKIEKNLIQYYPIIKEANTISEEFKRRIEFVPFVASINLLNLTNQKHSSQDLVVNVKVINKEDGWVNYWSIEKFEERLELMREVIENFFNYNMVLEDGDNDPFWDPAELILYARGFCMLKNNLYRFRLEHKVGLLGYDGDIGYLMVSLIPVDEKGEEINEEEMEELIEEPIDLVKNDLSAHMKIEFKKLIVYQISELVNKKFSLSYEILTMNGLEVYNTPSYTITDNQVNLNYSQFINLEKVSPEIIDYYMSNNMQIRFFTESIEQVQALGKLDPPRITVDRKLFHHDYNKRQSMVSNQADDLDRRQTRRKKSILEPLLENPSKENLCLIF